METENSNKISINNLRNFRIQKKLGWIVLVLIPLIIVNWNNLLTLRKNLNSEIKLKVNLFDKETTKPLDGMVTVLSKNNSFPFYIQGDQRQINSPIFKTIDNPIKLKIQASGYSERDTELFLNGETEIFIYLSKKPLKKCIYVDNKRIFKNLIQSNKIDSLCSKPEVRYSFSYSNRINPVENSNRLYTYDGGCVILVIDNRTRIQMPNLVLYQVSEFGNAKFFVESEINNQIIEQLSKHTQDVSDLILKNLPNEE